MPQLQRVDKELPIKIKSVFSDSRDRVNANVDISVEYADRSNEVVLIKGIDDNNYKKNNVILWGHDPQIPAIGNMMNLQKDGKTYSGTMVFHGLTETSRDVAKLISEGVIQSVSIGFIPLQFENLDLTDEIRSEYKFRKESNSARIFTKSEIVEVSVVNIPANQYALIRNTLDKNSLIVKYIDKQTEVKEPENGVFTDQYKRSIEIPTSESNKENNKKINIDRFKLKSMEEIEMENIAEKLQELSNDVKTGVIVRDEIEAALNSIVLENKAGRVLSSATQTKLKGALTAMGEAITALNGLIEAASNEIVDEKPEPTKAKRNAITEDSLEKLINKFAKID